MCLAIFNGLRVRKYKLSEQFRPSFSLIVPSHNEEKVIERTINNFLKIRYPQNKKEMIIINDGSADRTKEIIEKYASKIIDSDSGEVTKTENSFGKIILINRQSGGSGKANALNCGNKHASGEILFFIDADIQFDEDVFERASRHFIDEKVGAVSGYVQVVENKNSFLNQFLDFEYVVGQQFIRRGFNVIGIHYIVPGGCAIFRRKMLEKVGGYHSDTLAEDTDITWRIITETKNEIHFDPSIVVAADEPTGLIALWNQRVRWARGNIEVTLKHKHKIGNPKYGRGVTWGYPFWIGAMILPFAFILSSVGLVLATIFNLQLDILPIFGKFLGVSFFVSWIAATIMNKGRSWLAGLLTPGIPALISLSTLLIIDNISGDLFSTLGYSQFSILPGLLIGLWILISIPGTYLCIGLANKFPKLSAVLQFGVFGYWMFIITSIFHGYIKEIFKQEKKWIRTER